MIVFSRELLKKIGEHARREAPREACGILAGEKGDKKLVRKVYECRNVDENPYTTYTIDAGQQLEIMEEIEGSKLELLGFYHSHPCGPAYPSSIDVGRAMWHGHSHVIISLAEKLTVTSWIWDEEEERFVEERIEKQGRI